MSEETATLPIEEVVTRLVSLHEIDRSVATQFRAKVNQEMIDGLVPVYKELQGEFITVEPVDLFESEGHPYYIGDGHQRIAAATIARIGAINARIHKGGLREAQIFALGCNAKHDTAGTRRSEGDLKKSISWCLDDAELKKLTQREIARLCNCSHTYVQAVVKARKYAAAAAGQPEPEEPAEKTGKGGRKYTQKPKANGTPSYDWKGMFDHYGYVARVTDDVTKAYPDQKDSPEFHQVKRLTNELAKVLRAWKKKVSGK